jgi:hypothetical protein
MRFFDLKCNKVYLQHLDNFFTIKFIHGEIKIRHDTENYNLWLISKRKGLSNENKDLILPVFFACLFVSEVTQYVWIDHILKATSISITNETQSFQGPKYAACVIPYEQTCNKSSLEKAGSWEVDLHNPNLK